MKKKKLLYLLLLPILSFLLFYCADSTAKAQSLYGSVRIEYSRCNACDSCRTAFQCPQGAISRDPQRALNVIDEDKCVKCLRCMEVFTCPRGAIMTSKDLLAPGDIDDLSLISQENGMLVITFTAPGDDDSLGSAYRYEVGLKDAAGNTVAFPGDGYDYTMPGIGGYQEYWLLEGMPENGVLTFSIRAYDEVGLCDSLTTGEVVIMGDHPDVTPPSAVTDLQAQSSEDAVTLSWTAPGDDGPTGSAASYELRRAGSPITAANWATATVVPNPPVPHSAGLAEIMTITGLPAATTLWFAVKAVDEAGNWSTASNSPSGQATGDLTAPAGITNLSAASTSANALTLTWTAPGDNGMQGQADHYLVKVAEVEITASNWAGLPLHDQDLTPQSANALETLIVTGLTPSTTYYAAVIAVDDNGNSGALSNTATTTTEATPDNIAPDAVTDLTVTPVDPQGVLLEWTAPGDDGAEGLAAYYDIRMSQTPITNDNWATALTMTGLPTPEDAGTIQSYAVDGLLSGVTYYFAMKTCDDAGNVSGMSNLVNSQTAADDIAPGAITDMTVVAGVVTNLTSSKIRWTAPHEDGASGGVVNHYELRWASFEITDANWDQATVASTQPNPSNPGGTQNFTVTGLTQGAAYYFAIRSYDENGNVSGVSNSPAGHTIYQIMTSCHDCSLCINTCPQDAIYDAGPRKQIHTEMCDLCGTCVPHCPYNLIRATVVAGL
jgi:ferredoxin